uniref:Transmembrane protein n=1 Tax=Romanomermis culicivorax TaxID=13658 RepID=A0A915HS49_ROMCU
MASTGTYIEQSLSGLVPVTDQQAFKIAFYNALSIVFVVVVSFLFCGVYHLLQAFFRPVIWAVLCGTVLFPFKKTVASCTECWLEELNASNTPFLIGLILIPLRIIDKLASIVWKIGTSKDAIIFVTISAVFVGLTCQNAFNRLVSVLLTIYSFLDSFISVGSSKWAIFFATIYVFAFAGYLYFGAKELHKTTARFLSVPIWVAVLCVAADLFSFFRVIVFGTSSIVILLIVLPSKDSGDVPTQQIKRIKQENFVEDSPSSSNKYIYVVFGGCCFLWILQSPVVLSECFGIWNFMSNTFNCLAQVLTEKFGPLIDLVIPSSIRQFVRLVYYGDKQVIDTFKSSAGVLSSIIVMIGLVLGLILMSVFFVFQLKDEATHLAQLSGNLLNRTLSSNPQYAEWFTNATNLGGGADQLNSVVDDAFKYSRNWLGGQARLLAKSDDSEKADLLEVQVIFFVSINFGPNVNLLF